MIDMTEAQKKRIDAIYKNCLDHLTDTAEYWQKAYSAFEKTSDVFNDREVDKYIVSKMQQLEKELGIYE